MKKIIIGAILVIVAWLGSVAFIGVKSQSAMTEFVAQTDSQVRASGFSVTLSAYEKSFFSSTAEIELDIIDSELKEDLSEFLSFPIRSTVRITHGPIFQGGGIGMLRLQNNVLIGELLSKEGQVTFLDAFTDDIKILFSVEFSLLGSVVSAVNVEPFTVSEDGAIVTLGDNSFSTGFDLGSGLPYTQEFSLSEVSFMVDESPEGFVLKGLGFASTTNELFGGFIPLGDVSVSIDSLELMTPELDASFSLTGSSTAKRNDNGSLFAIGEIVVLLDSASLPDDMPDISAFRFGGSFSGLSEEATVLLFDAVEMTDIQQQDQQLLLAVNKMLESDQLSLGYYLGVSDKNNQEATAEIKIDFVGHEYVQQTFDDTIIVMSSAPLLFFEGSLSVQVPKEMAVGDLQALIDEFVRQGFIVEKENFYAFDFEVSNQRLYLNGNDATQELGF